MWINARWVFQGIGENRVARIKWVSHSSDFIEFTTIVCPLGFLWFRNRVLPSGKDLRMIKRKVWQWWVIFAEGEWTSTTSATTFTASVAAAFAWKSARVFPWYSVSVLLVWASILITAISESNRVAARRSFTCCPFFIGAPVGVRKLLYSITSKNQGILAVSININNLSW